jgi:hypothetical protein
MKANRWAGKAALLTLIGIGRYPSRQPEGKWSDESVAWAKDPYPPEPPDASKPKGPATAATSK